MLQNQEVGKEVRLTEIFERKHLKCTWRTKKECVISDPGK